MNNAKPMNKSFHTIGDVLRNDLAASFDDNGNNGSVNPLRCVNQGKGGECVADVSNAVEWAGVAQKTKVTSKRKRSRWGKFLDLMRCMGPGRREEKTVKRQDYCVPLYASDLPRPSPLLFLKQYSKLVNLEENVKKNSEITYYAHAGNGQQFERFRDSGNVTEENDSEVAVEDVEVSKPTILESEFPVMKANVGEIPISLSFNGQPTAKVLSPTEIEYGSEFSETVRYLASAELSPDSETTAKDTTSEEESVSTDNSIPQTHTPYQLKSMKQFKYCYKERSSRSKNLLNIPLLDSESSSVSPITTTYKINPDNPPSYFIDSPKKSPVKLPLIRTCSTFSQNLPSLYEHPLSVTPNVSSSSPTASHDSSTSTLSSAFSPATSHSQHSIHEAAKDAHIGGKAQSALASSSSTTSSSNRSPGSLFLARVPPLPRPESGYYSETTLTNVCDIVSPLSPIEHELHDQQHPDAPPPAPNMTNISTQTETSYPSEMYLLPTWLCEESLQRRKLAQIINGTALKIDASLRRGNAPTAALAKRSRNAHVNRRPSVA